MNARPFALEDTYVPDATLRFFITLLGHSFDGSYLSDDDLAAVDWDGINDLSNYHRVDNLIDEALRPVFANREIPGAVKALSLRARRKMFRSLKRGAATAKICGVLRDANVDCLLMKSEAVAEGYYSKAYMRYSKDIDILIAPEDFESAKAALFANGYSQLFPEFELTPSRLDATQRLRAYAEFHCTEHDQSIELHWRLFRNFQLYDVPFSEFDIHSSDISIGRQKVKTMNAPHQLVYMMCHGAAHSWFRLKWLADIDRMVAQVSTSDIEQARQLAERKGVSDILETGLAMRVALFDTTKDRHEVEVRSSPEITSMISHYASVFSHEAHKGNRTIKDWSEVVDSLTHQLKARKGFAYWSNTLVQFFPRINHIKTLNLSRKWIAIYVVTGAFDRLFRSFRPSK